MKQGLDWYKRDPRAFLDGVQGLGPELIGAYAVLLDLIYARGGETLRDDRHLAGILGCSKRKAKALTDGLIERGKIKQTGENLTNERAENDAKQRRNDRETFVKRQRMSAEQRAKNRENNGLSLTYKRREEREKEYSSLPSLKSSRENDGNTTEANLMDTGQSEDWPAATTPANPTAENGRRAHGGDSRQNGSAAGQPACPSAANGSLPPLPSPADYSGLADDSRRRATDFILRQSGVQQYGFTRQSPTPEGDAFRIAFDRRRAKTLE